MTTRPATMPLDQTGASMTATHTTTRAIVTTGELDPPMPKVSAAIFVTLAQAILGLVVAYGIGVSDELQAAIVQLVTVLTVAIPAWDAWVRGNRARYFAAKVAPTVQNTINQEAPGR